MNKNSMIKVHLGEVFECDGSLYSITTPTSPSVECNLTGGRMIAEFIVLHEFDEDNVYVT